MLKLAEAGTTVLTAAWTYSQVKAVEGAVEGFVIPTPAVAVMAVGTAATTFVAMKAIQSFVESFLLWLDEEYPLEDCRAFTTAISCTVAAAVTLHAFRAMGVLTTVPTAVSALGVVGAVAFVAMAVEQIYQNRQNPAVSGDGAKPLTPDEIRQAGDAMRAELWEQYVGNFLAHFNDYFELIVLADDLDGDLQASGDLRVVSRVDANWWKTNDSATRRRDQFDASAKASYTIDNSSFTFDMEEQSYQQLVRLEQESKIYVVQNGSPLPLESSHADIQPLEKLYQQLKLVLTFDDGIRDVIELLLSDYLEADLEVLLKNVIVKQPFDNMEPTIALLSLEISKENTKIVVTRQYSVTIGDTTDIGVIAVRHEIANKEVMTFFRLDTPVN
jgi:hypothetical protein